RRTLLATGFADGGAKAEPRSGELRVDEGSIARDLRRGRHSARPDPRGRTGGRESDGVVGAAAGRRHGCLRYGRSNTMMWAKGVPEASVPPMLAIRLRPSSETAYVP